MFQSLFLLAQAAQPVEAVPGAAVNTAVQTVTDSSQAVTESFTKTFVPLLELAPKMLAAVVILAAGFVLARYASRLFVVLAETIGLQKAAERSGLAQSMKDVGIARNVPTIVGTIIFWLFLCVAIMASFKVLDLPTVSNEIQRVVNYIPHLLIATVVVVIGLLIANVLRGIIATSADRVGLGYANQLAAGCYYVLVLLTFLAAAEHLGLAVELLGQLVLIASGALALGFGLALGLGGRDVMGGILSGYYLRQRFQAGDHVRMGDMEGTVREVGPVATIIETDEEGLLHRHSVPNQLMLKEAVR